MADFDQDEFQSSRSSAQSWAAFLPQRSLVMARRRPPATADAVALDPVSGIAHREGDESAALVFLLPAPLAPQSPARGLFEKMVEALGLKPSQVLQLVLVDGVDLAAALAELPFVATRVGVVLGSVPVPGLPQVRGQEGAAGEVSFWNSWHPEVLLQRPELKREAWEDLQKVATMVGIQIPKRGGGSR